MENMFQGAEAIQDPAFHRAMAKAQKIIPMIKAMREQQKTEKLSPFTQALDSAASQYGAATTDEGRQQANALASLTRANMLKGGFNPSDIDQKYWGNTPGQFQVTGGYEAPITGYEGFSRADAMNFRRQALLDELGRRETEAGLTGIDPFTGQKTWGRQYQEMALAKSGSGGGGSASTKAPPSLYDQAKAAAYNDPRLYTGKVDDKSEIPQGSWALEDLISAYMKTYGGGGGQQSTGGGDPQVAALVQQARAEGAADDEIRATLTSKGHNPAEYGL